MEMYPDRAVDCDPLQHGDVVGGGERLVVQERHGDGDVQRLPGRQHRGPLCHLLSLNTNL